MSIRYVCRFCSDEIGMIEDPVVSFEALGLDQLTAEERARMISYEDDGHMRINITCEHCQETIDRHPELVLNDHILQ